MYGHSQEIDRFFLFAQKAGFLEFIGLSHKKALELPEVGKKLTAAIKLAKHHFIHPKEAPIEEPLVIAERILSLHQKKEKLFEEERILASEIERVAVFGDFSTEDIHQIEKEARRVVQFFCMKSDLAKEANLPPELIYIASEYELDYFIGIHKERKQYPKMAEITIEQSVSLLKKRLLEVREEKAKVEADLSTDCNALDLLEKGLIDCLNEHHLHLAKHDAAKLLNETLFMIEAWVPENRVHGLEAILSGLDVSCEEVEIEPNDQMPTCIENRGVSKVGEDLIHIYDVPSSTDKDPSNWLLFFFSLFFAIIIADAGYGLIFLILALVFKYKLPAQAPAQLKRFSKLFFFLSIATIGWGCSTASFFGIEIGPDNPYRKSSFLHYLAQKKADYHIGKQDDVYHGYFQAFPSVKEAKDGHDFLVRTEYKKEGKTRYKALEDFYFNALLEISLIIGILHLSTSILRNLKRALAPLGWVLFMIGGYFYFPVYLDATTIANFVHFISKETASWLGLTLLGMGPLFVLIVSVIEGKKWMALHELTNGIQVFSDVLSYLRLYALALAGIVMAETMNDTLGIEMGFIGTLIVILVGHSINIVMSVMSATIHGLRLNFLEWYRYSFEGGGRLFNPLRLRKVK